MRFRHQPLTKGKKLGIIAIVVTSIIVFSCVVYFFLDSISEKPEMLPPEERWQITEAIYENDHTNFTIRYVGESTAQHVGIHSRSSSGEYSYWDATLLVGGVLHKGDTRSYYVLGRTYSVSIGWYIGLNDTNFRVNLDVYPD